MKRASVAGRSDRRGSVAIEYALLLPALLLFVLGIMDAGRLLWTYTTLHRSVAAAARCGAVDPTICGTTAQIKNFGAASAYGLTINSSAYTVTTPACGTRVQATFTFVFIIPWLSPISPYGESNSMPLSAAACFPPSH